MTLVEQLLKQRTALLNQQDAFRQLPSQSEKVENSLKILLAQFTDQIELLEESVYQKIQVYDSALVDNLRSIPGIGAKTVAVLIMVAKGFASFTNHRQVISYIGLAPRIYQSGSSIKGKGQICKMGTSRIRSLLYMCALKATSCNTACKALFDRLRAKETEMY